MIRRSILGLKNVFGPNVDICRLLKKSGLRWLLRNDLHRTCVSNLEYLKSCGICSLRIATIICSHPSIFLLNQEKLKDIVQRVDDMGFERESNMFLQAVGAISSMSVETWEMKLKLFRDLGFSEENISYAFRVYPRVFTVSERKIVEVVQLLLSVEDFSVSDIVRLPVVLSHSEKRLKLRVRVLKALQGKNLLEKKPTFSTFFQMTHANFTKKYLIPYSDELGDLYVASQGS